MISTVSIPLDPLRVLLDVVAGLMALVPLIFLEAKAADIDARGAALIDVAEAINLAHDSETVNVPADTYQIWKVARLPDQSEVGNGDLLTGVGTLGTATMAMPEAWPNQVTELCYSGTVRLVRMVRS